MVYANELPVILVEEQPICRTKIVEKDLRAAIEDVNFKFRDL